MDLCGYGLGSFSMAKFSPLDILKRKFENTLEFGIG